MPKVRILLNNCFVGGEYRKAGTEVEVSKSEIDVLLGLEGRVEEIKVRRKPKTEAVSDED